MKLLICNCIIVIFISITSACTTKNSYTADAGLLDTVATGQVDLFDCTGSISDFFASGESAVNPLFENSVVSTDFDFITTEDPSEFVQMKFLERAVREMPDKRSGSLFDSEAFVFEASFSDATLEIWVHSSFMQMEVASSYANMLSGPLGRLPKFMRKALDHVVVHKGDETAFAEDKGHFFVVYSENMENRVSTHDLEETVFHETVHATLDSACSQNASSWNDARVKDNSFITDYAASFPEQEDMAESALFAYAILKHPQRLPDNVEEWLVTHIPNRLAFFRSIF